MLILNRRIGERLLIGKAVTLDILQVNGNQVRVGITAPKEVEIYREEVYARIKTEGKKTKDTQRTNSITQLNPFREGE